MNTSQPDNLEQALSFARYQQTLNNQRQILQEKFAADTLVARDGGLFQITAQWLSCFDPQLNWHIDVNGTPVYINDPQGFITEARELWAKTLAEYGEAWRELSRNRTVKGLVDL